MLSKPITITEKDVKSQKTAILFHLKQYGRITSEEAMNLYGIFRLSARIYDLKKDGYNLTCEFDTLSNCLGRKNIYAVYIHDKSKTPKTQGRSIKRLPSVAHFKTTDDVILHHLRNKGSISSKDALNFYGILRLSGAINRLRNKGIVITTETKTIKTRYGYSCRYAEYKFVSEPKHTVDPKKETPVSVTPPKTDPAPVTKSVPVSESAHVETKAVPKESATVVDNITKQAPTQPSAAPAKKQDEFMELSPEKLAHRISNLQVGDKVLIEQKGIDRSAKVIRCNSWKVTVAYPATGDIEKIRRSRFRKRVITFAD